MDNFRRFGLTTLPLPTTAGIRSIQVRIPQGRADQKRRYRPFVIVSFTFVQALLNLGFIPVQHCRSRLWTVGRAGFELFVGPRQRLLRRCLLWMDLERLRLGQALKRQRSQRANHITKQVGQITAWRHARFGLHDLAQGMLMLQVGPGRLIDALVAGGVEQVATQVIQRKIFPENGVIRLIG